MRGKSFSAHSFYSEGSSYNSHRGNFLIHRIQKPQKISICRALSVIAVVKIQRLAPCIDEKEEKEKKEVEGRRKRISTKVLYLQKYSSNVVCLKLHNQLLHHSCRAFPGCNLASGMAYHSTTFPSLNIF